MSVSRRQGTLGQSTEQQSTTREERNFLRSKMSCSYARVEMCKQDGHAYVHSTEGVQHNFSIFGTRERHAVRLQLDDSTRCLLTHILNGFLRYIKSHHTHVVDALFQLAWRIAGTKPDRQASQNPSLCHRNASASHLQSCFPERR